MTKDPDRRARLLLSGCFWAFLAACLVTVLVLPALSLMLRGLGRPAEPKDTAPALRPVRRVPQRPKPVHFTPNHPFWHGG